MKTTTDDLLSTTEVAERLGVTRRRVEQLICGYRRVNKDTGEVTFQADPVLPAKKMEGGSWVVLRSDLERGMREQPPGWPGRMGRPRGSKNRVRGDFA
jgi:hypothetical protein